MDKNEELYQKQKEALDAISADAKVSDDAAELMYSLAFNLWKNGQLEKAEKIYALLFMVRPNDPRYLDAMARCQYDLGHFDRALILYSHAGLCGHDEMLSVFHAGQCYAMMGDLLSAQHMMNLVVQTAHVNPSSVSPELLERASLFFSLLQKQEEKAEAAVTKEGKKEKEPTAG